MYYLINENIQLILDYIDQSSHIQPYLDLMNQLHKTDVRNNKYYQRQYRNYWKMNAALLSDDFYDHYFSVLEENKENNEINISSVARLLYDEPTHKNNKQSLQFAFATKLIHSINTTMPIFDKMVKQFYYLPVSKVNWTFEKKLGNMLSNYQFLSDEYKRVLGEEILNNSINMFREYFNVDEKYTDIKIIDSLIWKFVTLLNDGAIRTRLINYT